MIIFGSILNTFESSSILEAAGAVFKIGLSPKSNHYQEIELAQIFETLCRIFLLMLETHFLIGNLDYYKLQGLWQRL